MTLILSGTNGVSDIDGSAATPAIRGTDANTGIFFPAADTIAFSEGGAEAMRIDSSGNVGIGTSSPKTYMHLDGGAGASTSGFAGVTAINGGRV
jgi:Ca2+-binding RTX toxin-like protein